MVAKEITTLELVNFWVKITLQEKFGREYLQLLFWELPNMELRMKYNWYFKYRAALLQVQHPKHEVTMSWGTSEKYTEEQKAEIEFRNKLIAKKRTVTKYCNLLKQAEKEWNSLFPIQDDLMYQKAVNKIERLKNELAELENQNLKSVANEM